MSLYIENCKRCQIQANLLLDICRKNSETFIPIDTVQSTFDWATVADVRKNLIDDALYTIGSDGGVVYEPERVAVGERIHPSGFRPDPYWLAEKFPERRDLEVLLEDLRFATVVSDIEAAPLLTSGEHALLIRFLGHHAEHKVFTLHQLSCAWNIGEASIFRYISKITNKLDTATQGEWTIANEKRGGRYYVLQHNGRRR